MERRMEWTHAVAQQCRTEWERAVMARNARVAWQHGHMTRMVAAWDARAGGASMRAKTRKAETQHSTSEGSVAAQRGMRQGAGGKRVGKAGTANREGVAARAQ